MEDISLQTLDLLMLLKRSKGPVSERNPDIVLIFHIFGGDAYYSAEHIHFGPSEFTKICQSQPCIHRDKDAGL